MTLAGAEHRKTNGMTMLTDLVVAITMDFVLFSRLRSSRTPHPITEPIITLAML